MDNWIHPPDQPDLQPQHIDLWRVSLDDVQRLAATIEPDPIHWATATLSADEAERAACFHFEKDRHRFILAHACLRDVLSRYLRCHPSQLTFSINPYGKPALTGNALQFNLSHSGSFILIGVTRRSRIGVDVENIRSDMDLENIACRYFSQQEAADFMSLPQVQRLTAFFNGWTRKEAYIKAHGVGLSLSLDSFDVSLTPGEPTLLRSTRPDPKEATRWELRSVEVDPNHKAAVVVESHHTPEFRFWDWDFSGRRS